MNEYTQRTLSLTILTGYKLDDKSFFHPEVNNSNMPVNMTGKLNIFIFKTIVLVFSLSNSQPNNLNLTWATLNEHCKTGVGSLVRVNNNSGSLTELLIRPLWSSVDGNYTPWIADMGCFECRILSHEYFPNQNRIQENNVTECYLECQKENFTCRQNEPVYFALKGSLCVCVCNIQGIISPSSKCNMSCSSDVKCNTDNYFRVYMEIEMEDICYCMKEDNDNLNFSTTDCAQQLPLYCGCNVSCIRYNGSEGTLTTLGRSSKDISSSKVQSFEVTATTTVKSSELSSKNPHEVPSSNPYLISSTSFDKAIMSSTDTVGAIVGLFVAVFALTSLVLLLRFYREKRKRKLRDSQNDVQQPQSSQTVNNTYTDMMLVSGTNRNQNDVVFTTSTTNDVRNDDIYVENEEGEYDHLHSSRPKQVVSEQEDERYATSTQMEDVSYSTVRKSRNSISDRDNEYDNTTESFDNDCHLVVNPDYDFCYQSSQRKDC